ncbi:MAG TPA: multicopper oxidase domain-containing protein [Nitrososphaeraceae archaeon]|nr:multicopper oxidase domain-containing protein [Nitrososphaeraceae archaeon]
MRSNLLIALVGVAVSIAVVVTFSTGLNRGPLSAQDPSKRENFGGHSPGYPILGTTGDVLDPTSLNIDPKTAVIDPMKYLREFNYGRTTALSNGTSLREYTLIASDQQTKEVSPGVFYNVWTFNGTIPGPTLRATEGDLVRVTLINNGTKFHSIHFHGIHPSEMDGVFEGIAPGGKFTYEFTAEPFGVFPYHCHMQPLEEHITHGLYGVFIIDPKKPRADADEMVMVMNGYDTDFDAENNFYTVNGIPYYYMHHPIQIDKNRLIRIYLLNILEFDPINNFHLHANMFDLYRTGTKLIPDEYTDIVTMSQGERGILEFSYKYPGKYMFHAHKTEFAEKGWVGLFLVKDSTAESATENSNFTSIGRNATYSTSEFSNTGNGTTSFVKTGGLN